MNPVSNLWRLIRTGATFQRTGALDYAMRQFGAPGSLRITAKVLMWPVQWLGERGDPAQPPVVRAITALGPSYIKFGQILSTRPDVTGPELSRELKILQDKLPPFPMDAARREVERELGAPVEALFIEFSQPVAAASIAQVHRARRADTGEEVAVKIRRPGIARAFDRDIQAFYFVARTIELLAPKARRLKPTQVIAHFHGVVKQELDFRLEASAAAEFGANVEKDEGFRIPQVIWPLSSETVLTSQWVSGTQMGDLEGLRASGIDMKAMGARVVQVFLNHALRDGYFHADMHQGNLKVGPDGDLIALDFGIMGRIDAYTRRVFAEIVYGFLRQNYRRVAEVHFEAGYVPPDRDIDEFAQALRTVAEPIFGQDASRISMAKLLAHLFDVTERFGMETQTQLILLQRTMVVVEGVGRSLDPHMNMWQVARPVVERYIRDNLGPRAVARDLAETVRILSRFGPLLPRMAEAALIRTNNPVEDEDDPQARRRSRRRGRAAWALAGMAMGAAIALTSVWLAQAL
ncbi:2-polyprenylphenol 6-hydroxylase [Pontivivens ytuae]|uniref:2-polyprenylphenol 6-hydroxylase n=1 Tax=Pontivivens ytuae TaxID=2789856 RepID=A0A7S9QES1_9RHOB|nr:2-polyprenylphenol 6-hydroxylase [Pontivivens ytuae]QPH55747.1 2-polyprenylphenol 6-hydroxylase [Pontivivens ytuae]